jgi:hypothetical protein
MVKSSVMPSAGEIVMGPRNSHKRDITSQVVVAHTINPSTQEVEAGGSLNSRPAWSIEQILGQPQLLRENLSPPLPISIKRDLQAHTDV